MEILDDTIPINECLGGNMWYGKTIFPLSSMVTYYYDNKNVNAISRIYRVNNIGALELINICDKYQHDGH